MQPIDRAALLAPHEFASEIERGRALAILDRIERSVDALCPLCARALVAQEIVESIVLGFQDTPHCHRCLAEEHGSTAAEFLTRIEGYVAAIACFRATWSIAAALGGRISLDPP